MVTVSNLLLPLFGTIWQKMKNQEKMGPGPILQERRRSRKWGLAPFFQATFLNLCKFYKSDPIVFLLTTESFYYIFLRGNTEKAEISGFMGGGIPIFNKRQRTSFLSSRLYLADNSSSMEMSVLAFLDEGMELVFTLKNPLY